ncbi:ankyrin repeat domain-containing protein [Amycolatopsis sp. GA6-003]|uniref:ankyrin repeat domain-containing protein n=1 Tax=Amycolatopsis sp. GA6-003 TaxID=2652444 RepID=UPI0039175704
MRNEGWRGFAWQNWTDLGEVRARLDEGVDPNVGFLYDPPLHTAAEYGSAEVVAELAARVADVDALSYGRTALWRAVAAHRPDNARVLVAAGADPSREMMSGWPPARLSLASPTPELPGSGFSLTTEEIAVVEESRRLIPAVGTPYVEGLGIACVAGIDVAEAVRRLAAEVVDGVYEEMIDDPFDPLVARTVWATEVPGGCVLAQPWGFAPQMPGVTKALSAGTTCYGMYANPKSGNQGSIIRDGEIIGWDLHPGGEPEEDGDVLLSCLYQGHALAYCFAYAGLRPVDNRSVTGPPDAWIRLPDRDYWA